MMIGAVNDDVEARSKGGGGANDGGMVGWRNQVPEYVVDATVATAAASSAGATAPSSSEQTIEAIRARWEDMHAQFNTAKAAYVSLLDDKQHQIHDLQAALEAEQSGLDALHDELIRMNDTKAQLSAAAMDAGVDGGGHVDGASGGVRHATRTRWGGGVVSKRISQVANRLRGGVSES
jgi:hypothetical protein